MAYRVVVVDDSATVRAVLKRIFAATGDIEVIGEADNGHDAVTTVVKLQPDAVLMDVEMPGLNGFEAIERIMAQRPTPILVLSSKVRNPEVRPAFEALRLGAVEVFPKPEVPADWEILKTRLPSTIRAVAQSSRDRSAPNMVETSHGRALRYVLVGASTGGPGAVRDLLASLGEARLGVAVVQHISPGFEEGLVEWLVREVSFDVRLATDGEELKPGCVRIAPRDRHLRIDHRGQLLLDDGPPIKGHRPAVDALFQSAAKVGLRDTAAVLLSGMGRDGVDGLVELRGGGVLTLVQDKASCAVFGMPGAALEAGAAELAMPPEAIGHHLASFASGGLR